MSEHSEAVVVRLFGTLRQWCDERGCPPVLSAEVAADGEPARVLATRLELPVDEIEGVFVNHTLCALDRVVRPGDRVAFVPYGTPGPHRFFLGLYDAGKASHTGEPSEDAEGR